MYAQNVAWVMEIISLIKISFYSAIVCHWTLNSGNTLFSLVSSWVRETP